MGACKLFICKFFTIIGILSFKIDLKIGISGGPPKPLKGSLMMYLSIFIDYTPENDKIGPDQQKLDRAVGTN